MEEILIVTNFVKPKTKPRKFLATNVKLFKTKLKMKKKYYLTTMMFLLMAMTIMANEKIQRTQDIIDSKKQHEIYYLQNGISSNEFDVIKKNDGLYYVPKHVFNQEGEVLNTLTFKYNLDSEILNKYRVASIMIYNNDYSFLVHPPFNTEEGAVVGIILPNVPSGIYDIYTYTYDYTGRPVELDDPDFRIHIDELVTIDSDSTIMLNVSDAHILASWEFRDENNELFVQDTISAVDGHWELTSEGGELWAREGFATWYLEDYDDYGTVTSLAYSGRIRYYEGGSQRPCSYINHLSNRYKFTVTESVAHKNGLFYFNMQRTLGTDSFPLKNDTNDYITYEEYIQRTPQGKESVQNEIPYFFVHPYDNGWLINGQSNLIYNKTPIGEDGIVKSFINIKEEGTGQTSGVSIGINLGLLEGVNWYGEEENWDIFYNYPTYYLLSTQALLHKDGSLEYVNSRQAAYPDMRYKLFLPAHPKFSFSNEQKTGIFGNSCPLNAITSMGTIIPYLNNSKLIILDSEHFGRLGESNLGGNLYSTEIVKYNNEEIYNDVISNELPYIWMSQGKTNGIYELTFTNTNVLVDDIPGKNVTTVYFDQTKEDWNSPVLKMLQFRDAENNVTDRFINPNEGTIMFAGGDFEPKSTSFVDAYGYNSNWQYEECQPMAIEVSYAPYGSDDWQILEGIEHQSEFDDIPGMGFFYSGSLASVNVPSENKWYDLKFRLVDESGNWQEQTLSPAFKIESLTPDAVTEVYNSDATEVARYSVDGRLITTPEPGINIVVMSDGTAHKVSVK